MRLRGGATRSLVWLITKRLQVQILPPQQYGTAKKQLRKSGGEAERFQGINPRAYRIGENRRKNRSYNYEEENEIGIKKPIKTPWQIF